MEGKKKAAIKTLPQKQGANPEQKKLSYDELVNVCNELQKQGQKLFEENKELRQRSFFARLNFLFEVVKNSDTFTVNFVDKVVAEIEQTIYPPAPEEEASDEENTAEE